jgi:hypothetical protein
MPESIDLTPSPRVLRMLGEIDFKAWQCLCEIIDNSIDSFITENTSENVGDKPSVKIKLPSSNQNDLSPSDILTISDNGKGMTLEALNENLKAGFTGNNPVDKMGLFGMGFNISTARLGSRTMITTSTKDSNDFLKVTIDFEELEGKGNFCAPVERIVKKSDEKHKHGTTIEITKLRVDHIKPLYQRKKITQKLGKIYGRIIREKDIKLAYDSHPCRPFMHCFWSEERSGQAKTGTVPAKINIDHVIDEKKYCSTCWTWLDNFESECPSCNESSSLLKRKRRIKGWIGIQRYFDADHYGVDLLRNGRVIEELDKSFFYWINPDEESELEYPVDGHQRLGRIVGELEIDFVKVTHQKDAFDKNTQDWRDVSLHIRGDGPIRPNIARNHGYPLNKSPLALLFSAFRTTKAGVNNLVPQRRNGQAMITDTAITDLVYRFNERQTDFQSDEKWWKLVIEANSNGNAPLEELDPTGGDPFSSEEAEEKNDLELNSEEENEIIQRLNSEPDNELSKNYSLDLFKNVSIRVVAEKSLESNHINGFTVDLKGAELFFTYWPDSEIFKNSLLTPADFLINELAYHLHSTAHNEVSKIPITAVELALREKYFPDLHPTVEEVRRKVRVFIDDLNGHLKSKSGTFEINLDLIEDVDLALIKKKMVQNESLSDDQVEEAIKAGEFMSYAPFNALKSIACNNPYLVFDGKFFSQKWELNGSTNLLKELQKNELSSLLDDISWFDENHSTSSSGLWRGRIKRLIGSLEILMNWRT